MATIVARTSYVFDPRRVRLDNKPLLSWIKAGGHQSFPTPLTDFNHTESAGPVGSHTFVIAQSRYVDIIISGYLQYDFAWLCLNLSPIDS